VGDFERDTAVEGDAGRYTARLSRDWEIWGPNGGYVAAIALRAAGRAAPFSRPATFVAHFLSVGEFDEVGLTVQILRRAKRAASLRVSMTQRERPLLEALVWVIDDLNGLEHDVAPMPAVPGPEKLKPIEELVAAEDRKSYRFWENLESRPIDWVHWRERQPGPPEWREWYRFRPRATCEDPFADAARSLLLVDTMVWPACCRAYPAEDGPGYVAPSLDVSVQFHRAAPQSEWLLVEAVAPVATQGLVGGRARVWSTDGQLLASGGSQLLCRPVPPN
jgi:acyl-CoA thioesterase-2